MVNVQFDESNLGMPGQFGSQKASYTGLIGFLINKGWAKSEKTANVILVSVIALCSAITISIILGVSGGDSEPLGSSPIDIQQMRHLPKI